AWRRRAPTVCSRSRSEARTAGVWSLRAAAVCLARSPLARRRRSAPGHAERREARGQPPHLSRRPSRQPVPPTAPKPSAVEPVDQAPVEPGRSDHAGLAPVPEPDLEGRRAEAGPRYDRRPALAVVEGAERAQRVAVL